jgi:hypothetical protein
VFSTSGAHEKRVEAPCRAPSTEVAMRPPRARNITIIFTNFADANDWESRTVPVQPALASGKK